jgi:hypothetical protein
MGNRGQMAMYEFLVIAVLIGIAGWATYSYIHKPTQNSIYQADSKPVIYEVSPTWFGCASLGAMKARENERVISNQVNSAR